MKSKNVLKLVFLSGLIFSAGLSRAQLTIESDFSWTNTAGISTSSTVFNGCNEPINVTMTSTPLGHDLVGTGAYIPTDPDLAGDITVVISFSPAIDNLSILMNDFDEGTGNVDYDGINPGETGIAFTPFTSITPVFGSPTFVSTGGNTGVDPNMQDDTKGWVNWLTTSISSVTFTYHREYAGLDHGQWGLLLDSMRFDCEAPLSCICSENIKFTRIRSISQNGETSSDINIDSDGQAISKLNISIPSWNSGVSPTCLDCDASAILNIGNIMNLPTIAGISPTFSGGGSSASEIVYQFPVPTVLNEVITLEMQYPPALKLGCCKNNVDYCVKIQMIDERCKVCETLLCTLSKNTGSTQSSRSSGKTQSTIPVDVQETNQGLNISPNPATDIVTIQTPSGKGKLFIYSSEGKMISEYPVNANRLNIDISTMQGGTYIVKYKNETQTLNSKFVIE